MRTFVRRGTDGDVAPELDPQLFFRAAWTRGWPLFVVVGPPCAAEWRSSVHNIKRGMQRCRFVARSAQGCVKPPRRQGCSI